MKFRKLRLRGSYAPYLLLIISLTFACGTGYVGYNTERCTTQATDMVEDIIIMEYVERAANTEVCTSVFGNKFHYMTRDPDTRIDRCEPMPNVVNVECFSNCSTKFYSCLIFHEDGYVVEDVRRFGEERLAY